MTENVREMTFDEEYEILQKEKEELFAMEKEDCEPPFANCVVRRALRCIRKLLEEIQQYRAIGTPEECRTAVERMKPYKPKEYEDKYYGCKCGEVLLEKWEEYPKKLMSKSWGLPYCLGCGQKLDWSE